MELSGWSQAWIPAAVSFLSVLLATPAVKKLALRFGVLADPRPDRWHTASTPLLGGVVIALGLAAGLATHIDLARSTWGVLFGCLVMFAVGLLDDLYQLSPLAKIVGCVVAGAVVLYSGLLLPWSPWQLLNASITMLWLIGITNAMNLLDGMDGLATGIALIAAVFLAISFYIDGKDAEMTVALLFAGAMAGFLVYNFSPASMFLGDCGSMAIGFFLASLTLMSASGRSRNLLYIIVAPVLPFLAPIFDTTFVTISRLASGRPISQGGRDHTFYRLARVAGSERNAVLIFYVVAIISGLLSVFVRMGMSSVSFALIPTFCLAIAMLGAYLGQVRVDVPTGLRDTSIFRHLERTIIHNGVFQVVLDTVLILISYYSSLLLRFEGSIPPRDLRQMYRLVPWFVIIKLSVFIVMGAYRHLWRYFGVASLMVYGKSVALSSALCVLLVLAVSRFEGFSRSVFVFDAILLLSLVSAARMAFQILQATLSTRATETPNQLRTLIYGRSELGTLLVRGLDEYKDHNYFPIGYIDDDPDLASRLKNGLPVLGSPHDLPRLIASHKVQAILVANQDGSCQGLDQLAAICERHRLHMKWVTLRID
jgi:UDP-GlcNAc:undecaprenyl-phosphate/decaprenyl-phosphate GlcNAc-1-phosphate transferase